jgi:hypothetical protein
MSLVSTPLASRLACGSRCETQKSVARRVRPRRRGVVAILSPGGGGHSTP